MTTTAPPSLAAAHGWPAPLDAGLARAGFGPRLGAADLPGLDDAKGAYLLLIRLPAPLVVGIPTLPPATLAPGHYVYCGSARGPGGIRARLARHFRPDKRPHWHIDRLTMAGAAMQAVAVPGGNECDLAARLLATPFGECGRFAHPVPGFGASDCRRCVSHLLKWTPAAARERDGRPTETPRPADSVPILLFCPRAR